MKETPEEWRSVPNSPLLVSSSGRVRSTAWGRNRILSPYLNTTGYPMVNWRRDGKRFSRLVHRLILEAFRGPCPEHHEARHLDGNRLNNHLNNLAWGTKRENNDDKIRHGTSNRRLSYEQAAEIRRQAANGRSCRWLAKLHRVSRSSIANILKQRTYRVP